MAIPFCKTSFAAGEISPSVWGRTDLAKYHAGASTMRNFFVNYRGGAITRAGTAFVGQCKQPGSAAPPRDIRFQFNVNQGYVLEFGDNYMRVKSNGAYVIEPPIDITGINQADPTQVSVATLSSQNGNLTAGDWVYVSGVEGMTEVNEQVYVIYNAAADQFNITDTSNYPVNSVNFNPYTGGGTISRIFTLVTPWAAVDLPWLKFTQSADVMTLCCVNQETGTEYPPYDLARLTASEWTLTETTFASSINAPASASVATQNTTSPGWTYEYVVTAVSAATGDESIASPIATVTGAVNAAISANTLTVTWAPVSGASSYNIYRADPSLSTVPVGALFGYVGSALGTQFQDSNITADMSTVPPQHRDPFAPSPIVSATITQPSTGLSQSSIGYSINTDTGSGAVLTPIVVSGALAAVVVDNGGENWSVTDQLLISPNVGTPALGWITFTQNPTNGQNIVLNGVNWTFVTAPPVGNQTQLRANLELTLAQLATDLQASTVTGLSHASYRADATQLAIFYNDTGTAGNAYSLSVGTTVLSTASGPTLINGSGTSGGPTAVLTLGPSSGTYPGGAAYFQQRRYYFNTLNQPDTYFASQPGSFLNMDYSIPTIDSDAIIGTPWAQQINGIQAMVPMQSGLVILTGSGAWQLTGGNANAVTPSDQVATPQAYNGISPTVPPIPINFDILYVQEKGSIIRDLAYNFFVNIFTGSDKTELSNHLFTNYQISQWAYAEEPYKLVWAVRDDGKLLSLTYLKEEDVYGWTRHDTNGLFVSVASVTEPPVDAVYLIVKRYIQNLNGHGPQWAYFSERMDDRTWQFAEDAWCVDCGLSYAQNYPPVTLTPAAATGAQNLTGVNLVVGGADYVNPVAQVIDPGFAGQPGGSGAILTVTQVGGVITSIVPAVEGSGYTSAAQIVVTDTAGNGVGCIAYPIITNIVAFNTTVTAFQNVAGLGAVGDVIRVGGGIATVTSFVSATQVLANIIQPITSVVQDDPYNTPIPQAAGAWSIINPISTVTNLNHLEGMTVSILADGGVVAPQTVTNGTITLEQPASQIIVGLPFTAQLQTLYMDVPGVQPTVQGRRKQIPALTLRTVASRGIQVGGNQPDASAQPNQATVPWTNMTPLPEMMPSISAGMPIPLITGDSYSHPLIGFDVRGQIAIQITDPVPCEITMLVPEVVLGDDPGP